MTNTLTSSRDIARLIEIMAALRAPGSGCSWDLKQTFATIAPYTIEEAYEVADAIARGDVSDLKDELGDLLLQVVYHSQMASEQSAFAFGDVVEAITRKMIRRHPHVFGSANERAAGAAPGFWEKIKAEERAEKTAERVSPPPRPCTQRGEGTSSLLADIAVALPALTRAVKLQDKAAAVGFDWPDLRPVFDKLREELAEFEEVAFPHDPRRAEGRPLKTAEGRPLKAAEGRPSEPAKGAPSRLADDTPSVRASDGPSPAPAVSPTQRHASGVPQANEHGAGLGQDYARIEEELGDLLFVMANIARHLKLDPESALRAANQKFTRRFLYIEARLAEKGSSPAQSTLEEMDKLWDEARQRDKTG